MSSAHVPRNNGGPPEIKIFEDEVEVDEDDVEKARRVKYLAAHIRDQMLPLAFSNSSTMTNIGVLHHQDLHAGNITIDEKVEVTSIVDCKCISAVPLWEACQMPDAIDGMFREQFPEPKDYVDHDSDRRSGESPNLNEEDENNEWRMYWEHLEQYK